MTDQKISELTEVEILEEHISALEQRMSMAQSALSEGSIEDSKMASMSEKLHLWSNQHNAAIDKLTELMAGDSTRVVDSEGQGLRLDLIEPSTTA